MLEVEQNIFSISTYNLNTVHDSSIYLEIHVPGAIEMKIQNVEIFANGIPHTLELFINPNLIPGDNKLIPVRHHISNKCKQSMIHFSDNPRCIESVGENIMWVIGDHRGIYTSGLNNRIVTLTNFIFEEGIYILKLTNKSHEDNLMCMLLNWQEILTE